MSARATAGWLRVRGGERLTVLIVDAQPAARLRVALALERDGLEVIQAESGGEALEVVAVRPVDALAVSAGLRGFDALALVRGLRAQPEHATLPVLVLSAVEPDLIPGDARLGVLMGMPCVRCVHVATRPAALAGVLQDMMLEMETAAQPAVGAQRKPLPWIPRIDVPRLAVVVPESRTGGAA